MGWPAHDPEGYDKVLVNAIVAKIETCGGDFGWGEKWEGVREALELIQGEAPAAFEGLVQWARDKIGEAESEYLTRCVR